MDLAALIPVAGMLTGLGFFWISFRYKALMVQSRHMERDALQSAAEKKRLEDRLAVLERIVTDRGIQTAEQIEALRTTDADQLRSLQGN